MYGNFEILCEGSHEGLEVYVDTIASLVRDVTLLENGYNADPNRREVLSKHMVD